MAVESPAASRSLMQRRMPGSAPPLDAQSLAGEETLGHLVRAQRHTPSSLALPDLDDVGIAEISFLDNERGPLVSTQAAVGVAGKEGHVRLQLLGSAHFPVVRRSDVTSPRVLGDGPWGRAKE